MKKVLLLDNFDSFTFNLYHHLRALGAEVLVLRNNFVGTFPNNFSHIVLSPGPGLPLKSGRLMPCIQHYQGLCPILGVCLGHQAIGLHLGGELYNLDSVRHGQQLLTHRSGNSQLLHQLPDVFEVGLYHSWALKPNIPLYTPTAFDEFEVLMAAEAPDLGLYGVQFHPESIMTTTGLQILSNFLSLS